MHFDNVNLTRPCRLVSRNARKMGTTHGRTQHTLKGTVRQIFSPPSFACDFHGRNRDKFYICSQALLIIYHEVKGGGRGEGEGEKGGGLGDHMVFIVAREYTDGTLN